MKRFSRLAWSLLLTGAVSGSPLAAQETLYVSPDTVVEAENGLISSNPSTFTGVSINSLLGANRFYSNGITGQNSIAANVEAGHVWTGHQTLTHATLVTPAGALGKPIGTPPGSA